MRRSSRFAPCTPRRPATITIMCVIHRSARGSVTRPKLGRSALPPIRLIPWRCSSGSRRSNRLSVFCIAFFRAKPAFSVKAST